MLLKTLFAGHHIVNRNSRLISHLPNFNAPNFYEHKWCFRVGQFMQGTVINRLENLPVVLCLKKVKFFFDTIAWIGYSKLEWLAGRLMRCLGEGGNYDFWARLVKEPGCHITRACFTITTISTRIFTYRMSTLIHVGRQSLIALFSDSQKGAS